MTGLFPLRNGDDSRAALTGPVNRPIAKEPILDSSLTVDPAIVEDFVTRYHIDFERMEGRLVRERQALIRYVAEIDFRRIGLNPETPMNFLEEELLESMTRRMAHEVYSPGSIPIVREEEGHLIVRDRRVEEKRDLANSVVGTGAGISGLELAITSGDVVDKSIADVPALLIVPCPWRPETMRSMMGLDKEQIRSSIAATTGHGKLRLFKLDELDVYFVDAGNHRVLGLQWAGDETIEAEVTTHRLDRDHVRIDDGILTHSYDGTFDKGAHRLLTRTDLKVARALEIPEVGRSLA